MSWGSLCSTENPYSKCGVPDEGYQRVKPCLGSVGCTTPTSIAAEKISLFVMSLPILIVLILGATGVMSATTMGWTVAGLAGAGFLIQLAGGDWKNRAVSLILSAAFASLMVTLGCLGGTGVLAGSGLITGLFVSHFVASAVFMMLKVCIGGCLTVAKNRDAFSSTEQDEGTGRRAPPPAYQTVNRSDKSYHG